MIALNNVPSIVSQLRNEEERGKLYKKNIYENISENKSNTFSNIEKNTKDHSKKSIKSLLENLTEPFFIQDGDFNITWSNNTAKQILNLTDTRIKKTPCHSLLFNKSTPCSFCPMQYALKTKKTYTNKITNAKNEQFLITSFPLFTDETFLGVLQQIKSYSPLQKHTLPHELNIIQRQQTIIENAALGIVVLDENLNHLTVNPTFCGMTGFENTDLKKPTDKPIYWPTKFSQQIKTEMKRLKQKGNLKMETYFQRKDNSLFPVSIVGSTFIDKKTNEKHMLLIIDDITKAKKTERELKISQLLLLSLIQNLERKVKKRTEKIELLLKQKNEFINQLGHDLKNPLGPLINLVPILLKYETNPRKKKMLTVIKRNTDHMKNLITKTIELARLNSGNIKLHFEQIDLTNSCKESIIRTDHLLEQNNITIQNHLPKQLIVNADKIRIEELIDNIMTNAIKYSPNGGTITITGSSTETTATLSFKDTGIGMNQQQLNHIFDEFYKADPARHDFKSSGLGTSIMKRIVEKHGGHIKIESDGIGKGTKVTFTILKHPLKSQNVTNNSTQKKNNSAHGEKK